MFSASPFSSYGQPAFHRSQRWAWLTLPIQEALMFSQRLCELLGCYKSLQEGSRHQLLL